MGELVQFPRLHNRLVSKAQLARHWRCSPRTIERRVHEGLPSELIEGCRYFRLAVAEDWRRRRGGAEEAVEPVDSEPGEPSESDGGDGDPPPAA